MESIIIPLRGTCQVFVHRADDGTLRGWDATVGNLIVRDGRAPMVFSLIEQGVTEEVIKRLSPELDEEYAMMTDLSQPLLFIPFEDAGLLIDGWHRLWKAHQLGVAELLVFLLTQAEADLIKVFEKAPWAEVDDDGA